MYALTRTWAYTNCCHHISTSDCYTGWKLPEQPVCCLVQPHFLASLPSPLSIRVDWLLGSGNPNRCKTTGYSANTAYVSHRVVANRNVVHVKIMSTVDQKYFVQKCHSLSDNNNGLVLQVLRVCICDTYLWYINSTMSFSSQGDPGPEGPRGLPGMVGPQVGLIFASTNVLHLRRILSDWMLNFSFLLFLSLCDRAQQDRPGCLDWKVIRWSKYLYYCSASVCNMWLGRTILDPCDILLTHPANSVLCISV